MPRGVYDRSKMRKPTDSIPSPAIEGAEFDADASLIINEYEQGVMPSVPDNAHPVAESIPVTSGAPSDAAHPLERAPVNSKIVVTPDGAWLATGGPVIKLPKSDPASKLPPGARIQKQGHHRYVATQLSAAEDHPDTVNDTALAAITTFNQHFHGVVQR